MISQLSYRISFPSTGKEFSQNLVFKKGLTVIRGANETGKSLILEMIRYALFGVDALRGDRSDYDVLDVNLTFDVRGESYRVVRSGSKAFLNGKLAVGTAAVNRKIKTDILGFDLDVFDLACAAMQGDLDKLTKRMRPGERRRMVEEVIGLDAIEEEEKVCRAKGNEYKRNADSIEKRLVAPEPPEKPENYESSDVLERSYRMQLEVEAERSQLLKMVEPQQPQAPDKPEYDDDVDVYETRRLEIASERRDYERTLREIPSATRTRQDTDRALEYWRQANRGPRPKYSESDLNRWESDWQAISTAGTLVECPSCGVEFNPATNSIHTLPEEPPITLREIRSELVAHERWRGFDGEVIQSCDMTEQEAKEQDYALSQAPRHNEILDALSNLPDLPSREQEAERKRLYLSECAIYDRVREAYEPLKKQWEESRLRLSQLPEADPDLEDRLKESRWYEEQSRRYDADKASHEEAVKEVESEKAKAEGWFKASEALKDVRLEAKQHLVPSLSRVASHLLSEMTDGKGQVVVVNEDFDITVDAQPVHTLSGSGISVVNLALRIALGQVLTQRVVPLFLADEIDHDMDQKRAEATHASLKKLTNTLEKVIVVTHKNIEGDHLINLE